MDDITRYKMKTEAERLLGWDEEDDIKGLKIIILKNMFAPSDFYVYIFNNKFIFKYL
jgi:hypothetical protein